MRGRSMGKAAGAGIAVEEEGGGSPGPREEVACPHHLPSWPSSPVTLSEEGQNWASSFLAPTLSCTGLSFPLLDQSC